jgi:hypothetical protein
MVLDWREIAGVPPQNNYNLRAGKESKTLRDAERDYLQRAKLNTSIAEDRGGANRWWEWDVYLQSDSLHWTLDTDAAIAWEGKLPGRGGLHDSVQNQQAAAASSSQQTKTEVDIWWSRLASDSRRGWVIVLAWALTGIAE